MMSHSSFVAFVHRQFVKNTTDDSVIKALLRAHEAQMRRNAYAKRKQRKEVALHV